MFGKRVVGEEAFLAAQAAEKKAVTVGSFGKRVVDVAPAVVVPVAEAKAPAPVLPPPPPPTPVVTEAYNGDMAIEVAKKNVHDLPRLLDLELARPSGPRKTVLRAYSDLALNGVLPDEVGLALDERITAALESKE